MKTVKGTVLCRMSISLAILALGCGNAIESAANGRAMLGYAFLALSVFLVALILAEIGVNTEDERMEHESRKN